jgi:hypothetical protein
MTSQAKLVIGGLVALVVILATSLAVALAADSGNDGFGHMGARNNSYMSMMQAFGNMDSNQMLTMMREVLGEDGYRSMLEHFAEHRGGAGMPGGGMDGMMHQMMDGMMQQMSPDRDNIMPMMPR